MEPERFSSGPGSHSKLGTEHLPLSREQAGELALGALGERRGAWPSTGRGGEGYEMGAGELGSGSWEFFPGSPSTHPP